MHKWHKVTVCWECVWDICVYDMTWHMLHDRWRHVTSLCCCMIELSYWWIIHVIHAWMRCARVCDDETNAWKFPLHILHQIPPNREIRIPRYVMIQIQIEIVV